MRADNPACQLCADHLPWAQFGHLQSFLSFIGLNARLAAACQADEYRVIAGSEQIGGVAPARRSPRSAQSRMAPMELFSS
jgi:hypothetical protein